MRLKNLVQGVCLGTVLAVTSPLNANDWLDEDKSQFVATNTANVKGVWYEHGWSGGWYGPNQEYNFKFLSLKQYGTNIQGVYQDELYNDRSGDIVGTINSNRLTVIVPKMSYGTGVTNSITINVLIDGEEGRGTNFTKRIGPDPSDKFQWAFPTHIERVSTNYNSGRVPPKSRIK